MRGGKREGAGRPPQKTTRRSITVRLPGTLIDIIDQLDESRTEFIEVAVENYLLLLFNSAQAKSEDQPE